MGKLGFSGIFFLLLFVNQAFAKTVSLSWDQSPSALVVGYKVYYKADSSSPPFDGAGAAEGESPIDVGNSLNATITGLADNQDHYFSVTAYIASGEESVYSNIVLSSAIGGSGNSGSDGPLEIAPSASTGVPVMNGWWLFAAVGGGVGLLRQRSKKLCRK